MWSNRNFRALHKFRERSWSVVTFCRFCWCPTFLSMRRSPLISRTCSNIFIRSPSRFQLQIQSSLTLWTLVKRESKIHEKWSRYVYLVTSQLLKGIELIFDIRIYQEWLAYPLMPGHQAMTSHFWQSWCITLMKTGNFVHSLFFSIFSMTLTFTVWY